MNDDLEEFIMQRILETQVGTFTVRFGSTHDGRNDWWVFGDADLNMSMVPYFGRGVTLRAAFADLKPQNRQ
jgi:hypothetical protein